MRCQPFRGRIQYEAISPVNESSKIKQRANNCIEDDDDCWYSKDVGHKRKKLDSTNKNSNSFAERPSQISFVEQPKRIEKTPQEVLFLNNDDNHDTNNYEETKNDNVKSNNDIEKIVSNHCTNSENIDREAGCLIINEEHFVDTFIKEKDVDYFAKFDQLNGHEPMEEDDDDECWLSKEDLSQKSRKSDGSASIEKSISPLQNFQVKSQQIEQNIEKIVELSSTIIYDYNENRNEVITTEPGEILPIEQTLENSIGLKASAINDNDDYNPDDDTSTEPGEIPPSDSETEPGEIPPSDDESFSTEPGEIPLSDSKEGNDDMPVKEKNDEINLPETSNNRDSWLIGEDEKGRRFADTVIIIRMGIL